MLVTVGQINTINGDWESNTASIIRAIEQGKKDGSESRDIHHKIGFLIVMSQGVHSHPFSKSSPQRPASRP
jgi:hypothetical protein